jgi:prepilin-type N-terminal cleavage/methylation domain-containing protein
MVFPVKSVSMSKHNGLTLIEVLIALTILSVSVLGIVQSISVCSQNATKALRLAEATEVARREMVLAVMAATGGSPAAGGDGVYQWKVKKTEKGKDLLLISVTVSWAEKGSLRDFSLSRIVDTGKNTE